MSIDHQPPSFMNSAIASPHPRRVAGWRLTLPLATLLAALLAACQTRGPIIPEDAMMIGDDTSTNTVPLSQGDVIRVMWESATNLNSVSAIMLDGTVSLPLIGQTKAAGMTLAEFEAAIKALYEPQIKTPDLIVSRVTSAASYSVGGAVVKPGKLPLDRPMTVLEAIMEAGGVNYARAKLGSVVVLRIENGRRKRYVINLKKALRGDEPNLFYLKPFDLIYVPEKTFNL
jgi:polysaccharide export outer membrane protein